MMEIDSITVDAKTLKQESTDYVWRTVSLFSDDVSVSIENIKEP